MALEFGLGSVEWAPWSGTSWLCLLLVGLIYVSYSYELRVKAHGKKVAAEGASPKAKSLEEPLIRAEQGYGATGPAPRAACMAIIYTNAWILDNMCPHAATLTAIQQGFGAVMAALCVFVFKLSEPVEGMSAGPYCKYILPLSLCFTVYLWGSNAAYIYLAPGFVQMIKPMGSAIVFLVATALGLEEYSHYKAVNFLLICAGIAVTAYSKFDGSLSADGSSQNLVTVGLVVLIGAYTVVAFYNTGLQMLQKRGVVAGRFNPMTTLLYIAPATTLSMAAFAAATEWSRPDFQCFDKLPLWLLALDCGVAFVFNLSMMLFIGKLSAVAYPSSRSSSRLVVVAFLLFSENITRCEIEGYFVTLVAVAAFWGLKRPQTEEPAHAKFELYKTRLRQRPVTSGPGRPSADDGFAGGELPVSWDDRPTSALPVVVMPRVSGAAEALELRRLQKKLGLDDAAAAELNLQEAVFGGGLRRSQSAADVGENPLAKRIEDQLAALPPLEKRPRTAPKPRPRAANLRAPKRSAYYGPAHRGRRSRPAAPREPRSANGFDKLVKTVARMQQAKLHAAWNAWLERVRAHRRHLAEARYLRKHGAATMWTKIVDATRRLVKAKFAAWLELVFELRHVENAEAREAAAITMQRGTRGHAARQEMRRRRAAKIRRPRRRRRGWRRARGASSRGRAASRSRAASGRGAVRAICIQACWRAHAAYAHVARLRSAKKKREAAQLLQTKIRCSAPWRSRRKRRERLERLSSTKIQSLARRRRPERVDALYDARDRKRRRDDGAATAIQTAGAAARRATSTARASPSCWRGAARSTAARRPSRGASGDARAGR
ncbi:hypothetical protein JL722_1029 [Aureococcus anophagefferens]|nr:hypothetical protein JL722_1029 [Aureococcus anophagefferens]